MIRQALNHVISMSERLRIGSRDFVIVSNNCWGGEIYPTLRKPYNTPFIGLYFHPDCYLQFLENFEDFISADLTFRDRSRYFGHAASYPVGVLSDNVEIHFLHYQSADEAKAKWVRRAERLRTAVANGAPVFVKLCDREGCTKEHFLRFHALPFCRKISLGIEMFPSPEHLAIPGCMSKNEQTVGTGWDLFRKRYRYFDFAHWITTGQIQMTAASRLIQYIS